MSTGLSWTELGRGRQDLAALLAFRRSGLTAAQSRRLRVVLVVVVLVTLGAVLGPAYLAGPTPRDRSGQVLALLPSMCLGFWFFASFSAIASGGGREVVPRDQAVAYPVSTTADHLGALLLSPLNIAWLIQSWTLLGLTSYALGPEDVLAYELPILLWIVAATAMAQIVGWLAEGVRRGRHGVLVFRLLMTGLGLGALLLVLTDRVTWLLDRSPTGALLTLVLSPGDETWFTWAAGVVVLVALAVGAAWLGALPARWALLRPMREELRLESGRHPSRPNPGSDLAMLLRLDRAAVWRSVPLRRGLAVLALMPGVIALAGGLEWRMLTVLPGLVASGAALLFGVNTWCLDGRGALWRDSLPVSSRTVFLSRALVLLEVLVGSALLTIGLAALRAGAPSVPEVVALACSTLVVAVQVVGAGMRWSIQRPYAVDMRSARATPAPPVVMAGYSARLALATTMTGLLYSGLAQVPDPRYAVAVTVLMLGWSLTRIGLAERRWADPVERSRVVATVAG